MQKSFFPLALVFCLVVSFFSCSNTPKRSRKPVSLITIQPVKNNYTFDENVSVNVNTKLANGDIDNIKLYFENHLLEESKKLDFTVDNVKLDAIGNKNFKVVATKTDGVDNTRIKTVSIVSNVVPQKYTYEVVNVFPHLKTSFTEGLEYYKGFIYESTGNYGESEILKINLSTGNAVQHYKMEDFYFGEGITILNDKIYQLTYKAQKGFIYNLSDFARIDSFQYSSKEGWGLTNDGKNLIMSNGTSLLTWINPEDFSVVKTLQVANNKGLINNINELEYVNGIIYANIYTTNLIIEIDAETGKVLSEINMDGLIDMYATSDRIDYMNGIAYDSANKRFFVTGKWWPRLFEVKFVKSE